MWRALAAPALAAARRRGRVCVGCPGAVRQVGTQTPLWRARNEAAQRTSAVIAARQARLVDPDQPGLVPHCNRPYALWSAEELAASAHRAAFQAQVNWQERDAYSVKCEKLVWALKDLPREQCVLDAIDAFRPAKQNVDSTLLQRCSGAGLHKCIELLLELRAKVNLKDETGRCALHYAVKGQHREATQKLLAMGKANVNSRDLQGRTPLFIAADREKAPMKGRRTEGVIQTLMKFGASMKHGDASGKQVLEACQQRGKFAGMVNTQHRLRTAAQEMSGGALKFPEDAIEGTPWVNAHVRAPKLVMSPVGYAPVVEGKVLSLRRGIRVNKGRKGPSTPKGIINWYSPRG